MNFQILQNVGDTLLGQFVTDKGEILAFEVNTPTETGGMRYTRKPTLEAAQRVYDQALLDIFEAETEA